MATRQQKKIIVLGAQGLLGRAVSRYFSNRGDSVFEIDRENYNDYIGSSADILINCNGSPYRFKANKNPSSDFEHNVTSVKNSLFDFSVKTYIYISTIDVYQTRNKINETNEKSVIKTKLLDNYGFHKWLAEQLVLKYSKNYLIIRSGTLIGEGLKKGPIFDILNGNQLRMSLESKLSLIDTNVVAEALGTILATEPFQQTYNVTGKNSVRLIDLRNRIKIPIKEPRTSDQIIYEYAIDTKKLSSIFKIPSSSEMTIRFINDKNKK